jgi:hypothetical protein
MMAVTVVTKEATRRLEPQDDSTSKRKIRASG